MLAELTKSCDKYGLDLGVYIYPGGDNWGAGSGGLTKDATKQEAYNKGIPTTALSGIIKI